MSSVGPGLPNRDSMRYMIGQEGDSGPKLEGFIEEPAKNKKSKAKKKEQMRLGNFTKMITVSLRKSAHSVVEDGDFVSIVTRGAQEILNAIHKTADVQLKDKYLKQLETCNKLLLSLQEKLQLLVKKIPEKNKTKRDEVLQISTVIESILQQFKKEKVASEIPAEVMGLTASFLPQEEQEAALDQLFLQFSQDEKPEKAKVRAVKEMEKDAIREKEVCAALYEALKNKQVPFVFPEKLKAKGALVTRLDLSQLEVPLTSQALREIILHMPSISELTLAGSFPEDVGRILSTLKNLRHLHLNCTQITNEQLEIITKNGSLRTLSLAGCPRITDLDFLKNCSQLMYLDCRSSRITSLQPIEHCPLLQHLNIEMCFGMSSLEPLVHCPLLEYVNLRGCRKIPSLEPLEGCIRLQYLDVGGCSLITSLAPLERCAELKRLIIPMCPGITLVEPLIGCTSLRYLDTEYLSSLQGTEQLQEALPNLKIRTDWRTENNKATAGSVGASDEVL